MRGELMGSMRRQKMEKGRNSASFSWCSAWRLSSPTPRCVASYPWSVTLRAKPKMFFNLVEPVGVLVHGNAKRGEFAFDVTNIALHPDERRRHRA